MASVPDSSIIENDIKSKTEVLVDGYLRRLFRNTKNLALKLPLDINHLCISFTYLPLSGAGQLIMWNMFNGTLDHFIDSGQLFALFEESQDKLHLAEYCVQNEVMSALRVMTEHVFQSRDLRMLLAVSAMKHRSRGSLSILLETAMDEQSRFIGAMSLFNAFKYQPHDRDLILFVMDKIGMSRCPVIAQKIAFKMQKMNITGTWKWIAKEYKDMVPNCTEIDEMVRVKNYERAPKRRKISSGWDDVELLYD